MRRNKILLAFATTIALTDFAHAQSTVTCGNCITSAGTYVTTSACCTTGTPSEETIATWAAKRAVAAQLTWFEPDKVKSLSREDIDKQQQRVDEIRKWAKTLSNQILATAYAGWGADATFKLQERRNELDKYDLVKSLVIGLPTPPEMK